MVWMMIVAIAGVLILLFFFFGLSSNSTSSEGFVRSVDKDALADAELQSYLPDQKINAIKRYRELTGAGLKEAKEAVEYAIAHPGDKRKSQSPSQVAGNSIGVVDWDVIADAELQSYLPDYKINAIKRYRELTGLGLKEAKEAIEYVLAHPEEREKSHKLIDTDAGGVRDLIAEGRIDEAIKLYASFMGIDEYSARDAIHEMQREMGLSDSSYVDSSGDY